MPYVQKIWVFSSAGRAPSQDLKLVVPNGLPKLILPFTNGLTSQLDNKTQVAAEGRFCLIGVADLPSIVDAASDGENGSIGIEFTHAGISALLGVPQGLITNQVLSLEEVTGGKVGEIAARIADQPSVPAKLSILLTWLCGLAQTATPDPITTWCLTRILGAKGRISVAQLAGETGYSARWLNQKFINQVGIGPKNLATIVRFQQYYQAWGKGQESRFLQTELADFYYDQSHFIRNFKRFTGLPPTRFMQSSNEFGRIFYIE